MCDKSQNWHKTPELLGICPLGLLGFKKKAWVKFLDAINIIFGCSHWYSFEFQCLRKILMTNLLY